jgi:hypothetical protein
MGNFSRHKAILLSQTTGTAASVTGTAKRIKPANDEVPDYQQTFGVVFKTTGASMSSTPSITPSLETSWDGTNWTVIATGTALTADGTLTEQKAITGSVGPYVRAKATIGGTATFTGTATLISNAGFTLAS